jgi:hypothetical protein
MSLAHGLVDYDGDYGLPVHREPTAKAGGARPLKGAEAHRERG